MSPWIQSSVALLTGLVFAITIGNPFQVHTKKLASQLLQIAVIGLGAGMNLEIIGRVGISGIGHTFTGIMLTLLLGTFLGKFLKLEEKTSILISVGTAICGGSAIAAVSPVIRARSHEISVSLAIVFVLNAVALILFPFIGHALNLSQTQFGLWSALAIHDTSSVVGATLQYGAQALEVGTTVKLARALWIIPVAAFFSMRKKSAHGENQKSKKPWFILGFLIAASVVTYFPEMKEAGHWIELMARRLMVHTLFIIGSNLTVESIREVGAKPFVLGVLLWIIVGISSLSFVRFFSL